MSYYYISNPYNGSPELRELRANIAAKTCGRLLKKGIHAWSPIVHNHAMLKAFDHFSLEERRSLILDFDFSLLRNSRGMIVLEMDGWKDSYGVKAELALCKKLGIPVSYLDPRELEDETGPKAMPLPTDQRGKIFFTNTATQP
jgi:hypothetical protein